MTLTKKWSILLTSTSIIMHFLKASKKIEKLQNNISVAGEEHQTAHGQHRQVKIVKNPSRLKMI